MSGWLGCFCPAGGMSRPRSLPTSFSHSSASLAGWARSRVSSATPPAQSVVLWHFVQLSLIRVSNRVTSTSALAVPCECGTSAARALPAIGTQQAPASISARLNSFPLLRIPPNLGLVVVPLFCSRLVLLNQCIGGLRPFRRPIWKGGKTPRREEQKSDVRTAL